MAFYGVFMWPFFMVLVYGRCKALERNGRDEKTKELKDEKRREEKWMEGKRREGREM